jgi:hypothetical protein
MKCDLGKDGGTAAPAYCTPVARWQNSPIAVPNLIEQRGSRKVAGLKILGQLAEYLG